MSGQQRAWGWAAALREGSTIPWQVWRDQSSGDAEPLSTYLPGAQQLGLLRRLNLAAVEQGRTVPRATADRILAAGVTGRGLGDLPVAGAGELPRFGPRPVDPDRLPAHEYLRVVAGLIADDIAALRRPPAPPRSLTARVTGRVARRLRPAGRTDVAPFVIVGAPWRARAARAGLIAQGIRPGGPGATAYVMAADLGTVVADAWTSRAFDQGGLVWTDFVATFGRVDLLPPRADLVSMARTASHKYGADRVKIVLDPAALAAEIGVPVLAEPPRLGAHAVDLVRRIGEPLGIVVPGQVRPRLLRRTLGERLDGLGGPGLTVPQEWREWLAKQAVRTQHEITAAGYDVLGDLDRLAVGPPTEDPVVPQPAEALLLSLDLILDPVGTTVKEES